MTGNGESLFRRSGRKTKAYENLMSVSECMRGRAVFLAERAGTGNRAVERKTVWKEKLDAAWCRKQQFDLAVSYTYRYILSDEQIRALGENVVNLHTSFLPWNRGADPNLWSFLEQTPRGVTLHYINAALDQGNIIAQELVEREAGETLKSSYEALDQAAKRLFQKAFLYYNHWESLRKLPLGKGSYHSLRDGERIKKGMATYDIPVETFLKETQNLLKSVNSPGGGGYSAD